MEQQNRIEEINIEVLNKLAAAAESRKISGGGPTRTSGEKYTPPVFNPDSEKGEFNYFEFKRQFIEFVTQLKCSDEFVFSQLRNKCCKGGARELI